jgi:archaemetzincin
MLHSKLDPPQEGDWLSSHKEKGESFENYVRKWPKTASSDRHKLYLVKLSSFTATQQIIFNKTFQYLALFYNTEIDSFTLNIDYNSIPEQYFRKNETEEIQVLTDFFLKDKLIKALPKDAWGMIGCTAVDIFPDPKWNFVFGQASLSQRVGVWSMRRLGDPEKYPDTEDKAFMRNLKVASHETGHILSMKHCVYYDCLMNGSAHILESDAKPPYLCPVCLGKADWNRDFNIQNRFDTLHWFWNKNQYDIYHQYYEIVKEIDLK